MNTDISLSAITRLSDLLEEVRNGSYWFTARPVNEYKNGRVQASVRLREWFCNRQWFSVSNSPGIFTHGDSCLIARINVALTAVVQL